ncbi:hypothetical protein SAMN05421743_105222 [Thalassobacillus cyri]|uniref:Uncharacterized protein n=1 Tax=Thalassobacillus cyri TaxID=571932 RepID=A0A1H4C0Y9_9BACI|nr:hypothetical protein [Thalassobacillus cyri]SEA53987.1 hypothetical protein SAMN05421743_105222 [Thalassobacillus cyri]
MTDIRSLDIEPLATITLSSGEKLDIPRLSTLKIIQIAKFAAIDGIKIYETYQETIENPDLTDAEKVAVVVSNLKDEQIVHLLSILLGISDQEALEMDPFDTLEIITTYVEQTDIEKAFTNVRKLMTKFNTKALALGAAQSPDASE